MQSFANIDKKHNNCTLLKLNSACLRATMKMGQEELDAFISYVDNDSTAGIARPAWCALKLGIGYPVLDDILHKLTPLKQDIHMELYSTQYNED